MRLYGEQAKTDAAAAMLRGKADPVTNPSHGQDGKEQDKKAYERAWKLAGGEASSVSKHAVRMMAPVVDAPVTAARVDAGESMSYSEANAAARAELGLEPAATKQEARTHPTSINAELGRALGHVRSVLDEFDLPAGAEPSGLVERLVELERIVAAVRGELERRGFISEADDGGRK